MSTYIRVASAITRQGLEVQDHIFKLLEHPKKDKDQLYIVVDGGSHPDLRNGRVRLYIQSPLAYKPIDSAEAERIERASAPDQDARSDDDIAREIAETFEILGEMTEAVATNVVKGLVISGPAGIGKSHTVETTLLQNLGMLRLLRDGLPQYEMISGGMTASVLYEKLWEFKDEGQVLVFDDCDGILYSEDSLNVLKAALDSKRTRRISWNSRSYHLQSKDIPNSFEYKGGIIFITNIDFKNFKSPRIINHLEAIVSRCHYIDIGIRSAREKIIHLKNVVRNDTMLKDYQFDSESKEELVKYIELNSHKLREISLRTVLKIASLKKSMPNKWELAANMSCCK